jgi:hypothetical protein
MGAITLRPFSFLLKPFLVAAPVIVANHGMIVIMPVTGSRAGGATKEQKAAEHRCRQRGKRRGLQNRFENRCYRAPKKWARPNSCRAPNQSHYDFLAMIAIMVVIVFVPVALRPPAVSVFIPPAMVVIPAIPAGFDKFVAPMFRFGTLPTVAFRGSVKIVIRFDDAFLAIVRECTRCAAEQDKTRKRCADQHDFGD